MDRFQILQYTSSIPLDSSFRNLTKILSKSAHIPSSIQNWFEEYYNLIVQEETKNEYFFCKKLEHKYGLCWLIPEDLIKKNEFQDVYSFLTENYGYNLIFRQKINDKTTFVLNFAMIVYLIDKFHSHTFSTMIINKVERFIQDCYGNSSNLYCTIKYSRQMVNMKNIELSTQETTNKGINMIVGIYLLFHNLTKYDGNLSDGVFVSYYLEINDVELFNFATLTIYAKSRAEKINAFHYFTPMSPFWDILNPTLRNLIIDKIHQEDYPDALRIASQELNNRLKTKHQSSLNPEDDGVSIMNKIFQKNNPLENLNIGSSYGILTKKNIQEGYRSLYSGIISAIRNPSTHEGNYIIDERDFTQIIVFISHLYDKVLL